MQLDDKKAINNPYPHTSSHEKSKYVQATCAKKNGIIPIFIDYFENSGNFKAQKKSSHVNLICESYLESYLLLVL